MLLFSSFLFVGGAYASKVFTALNDLPPSERFPSFIVARADITRSGHRTFTAPLTLSGLPVEMSGVFYLIAPEVGSGEPIQLVPEEKLDEYIQHERESKKKKVGVKGHQVPNPEYGKKAPPFVEGIRNEDLVNRMGWWYTENLNHGSKKEEGNGSIDLHRISFQVPKRLRLAQEKTRLSDEIWEVDPTQLEQPRLVLQLGVPPKLTAGFPGWVIAPNENDGENPNACKPPAPLLTTERPPGEFKKRFLNPSNARKPPKLSSVLLIWDPSHRRIYDLDFFACRAPVGNGKMFLAYASSMSEALSWSTLWRDLCIPLSEISFTRAPLATPNMRKATRLRNLGNEARKNEGKLYQSQIHGDKNDPEEDDWRTMARRHHTNEAIKNEVKHEITHEIKHEVKQEVDDIKEENISGLPGTKKEEPAMYYDYANLRPGDRWEKGNEYQKYEADDGHGLIRDSWDEDAGKVYKKIKLENHDRDRRIHRFEQPLLNTDTFPIKQEDIEDHKAVDLPSSHLNPTLDQSSQVPMYLKDLEIPALKIQDQDWAQLYRMYQDNGQAINPSTVPKDNDIPIVQPEDWKTGPKYRIP